MAAGGMGDVLTGIAGGFLAQGMGAEEACKLGVFAHGAAGDRAASERGEAGITASDLADALPAVIKDIPTMDDEPFIRIR
jgi:NAD(P)H-hydrate epimerase